MSDINEILPPDWNEEKELIKVIDREVVLFAHHSFAINFHHKVIKQTIRLDNSISEDKF